MFAGSLGCHHQSNSRSPAQTVAGARLFTGVDRYHRPITTSSTEAQRWFDQGLQFCYAFNHDEAVRSFEEAARLDPAAPMPWWGIAYAHGININDPAMTKDRWRLADEAAKEAQARAANGSPVEQALVAAISKRYSWPAPEDHKILDDAYIAAMREVRQRFPSDPDVGTLFAESMMDTQPWNYWTKDGLPKGHILEVIATIESVLALQPDHPGACHLYIHAVEASPYPEKAIPAADVLRDRIPGAGHLVHMPSHIYARVGRYADAADANVKAIAADRAYFEKAPPAHLYWMYFAHNLHFLSYSAMMEANYAQALKAARQLESEIPEYAQKDYAAVIDGVLPTTFHVMVRFGKWEEILREPRRPEHQLMAQAVRHYARGIALSARDRASEAREEMAAFERDAAKVPADWMMFQNKVHDVLPIAKAMLEGEIAFREGRIDYAFEVLSKAIIAEDALVYDEPPGWMLPVRHAQGALMMSAGRFADAERVYREDQQRNPGNGWSLVGLRNALNSQGRSAEASALDARIAQAWRRADTKPTSSCMCEPHRTAMR